MTFAQILHYINVIEGFKEDRIENITSLHHLSLPQNI